MSSSETFIKATVNSLKSRLAKRLLEFGSIAQAVPERFRDELNVFYEEVLAEAERLDNEIEDEFRGAGSNGEYSVSSELQVKIDRLRAKLKNLSREIEEVP